VFVENDAANPVPVQEQNRDASGAIKVHEQGTANVVVTGAVKIDPTQNTVQLGGQPIQVQATSEEQRFSVVEQAFSSSDTGTNCVDLTTLPAGTLLIESIDVHAFTGMQTYLFASSESPGGGAFGVGARIPVPLADYPIGTDVNGHATTALVVRDGGLAASAPGEVTRDDAHPVKLCVKDETPSSAINSLWTISGRAIG
jgi:hypothetical protein